jgi:hypothetical protein
MMKIILTFVILFLGTFCALWGQDFYDIETVHDIHLYFTQTNWDQLLDQLFAAGNEDRLLGTAVIDGVTYDSVGVRYKGNSSYNASRIKNPFNIKLDYMIADQLLGPYGTIKLANGFSDPSFIRETLSYEIARKYMPACRANYARVYVNDVQIGVYTSVQDEDSYFMNEHFHCGGEPRFKCDTNSFNAIPVWGYLGPNQSSYEQYYGLESDTGWEELINFTNVMSNNPTNLPQVFNIDQNLWMIAFDNLLVNLDSPINIFHNFYLFGDAAGRINPLLWDLNMSFGGFQSGGSTGATMDPLRNSTSSTYLLISRMMSVPRYKKMYIAHMRTMLTENFSNGWYATRGAELQAICGPYVQNDPNFFYTYANFLANLNNAVTGGGGGPGGGQSVPGITALMNARATYLLSNTNFAGVIPTIASIDHSPQNLAPNSTVNFTMTTTNAVYAQLGLRQDVADAFTIYPMFDDGAHNDGAANDGVYGVSVEIGYGNAQYYGWAESSAQGAFLPARAEHEFFEAEVTVVPGEIMINEIQAKNASYEDAHGDHDDWVELYNPGTTPINIGGMYMTDSHFSNGVTAWTQISAAYPDSTTIPAHGYLVVWYDEEPNEGILHINDKLGGGSDSVYLIDTDATTVIDSKSWVDTDGLNVDDVSYGRIPDGGATWQLFGAGQTNPCTPGAPNQAATNILPAVSYVDYTPYPTVSTSQITFSAVANDSDGTISDVELVWQLSSGTDTYSATMTFSQGHYTVMIGPFAEGTIVTYHIQAVDNAAGMTNSQTYTLTVGWEPPVLYINELMPSNTATIADGESEYEDWAEIYNPNDFVVDLAGYYITDDHYDFGAGTNLMSPIPTGYTALTTIPAHGFILAWFDEDIAQGPMHVNTKLSSSADSVVLIAPDMIHLIGEVSYDNITGLVTDVSWGRYPDGADNWQLFGVGQTLPATPGATNGSVASNDPSSPSLDPILSAYPNPMQGSLSLELKNVTNPSLIRVYNIKGQLVNQFSISGKSVWNGTDAQGKLLGEGIYLIKTTVNGLELIRKICIVK